MKLLFCSVCHDVLGLLGEQWRMCVCGASGGQYNKDLVTATIGGYGKVFGVGNLFFNELFPFLNDEGKRSCRKAYYGQPDTDAWWGDYVGERQIFHIASPTGPRVRVKIVPKDAGMNEVHIVDKREIVTDGKKDIKFVLVPSNPNPRKRQYIK